MKTKAFIITALLWLTCLYAGAQITYGVKISGGIASQSITNPDILSTSSIKTFNIRGLVQKPVKDGFWLEAGLGIAGKGSIIYNDGLTTTTRLTYLTLPVNVVRKFRFTNLGLFYLGAGGYLAMGLGGKLNYETPGSNTTDNVRYGKDNDLRKYDTGLNFSTGFEFRNQLTFNMAFSLGLNNIASETQQDSGTSVVKNREFSIGLGYLF